MPDILWKWVIIGNSGVGKTSLLQRLCNDEFNNTFISTIGIDFKIKKMEVAGKNITVQIWDTAGQERFGTITKSCYRGSIGVILVYGINDRNTYDDVNKWLNDIKLHTGERVARILVGNKCDLQASRAVTIEEGQALADRNEIPFMETSAKSGKNVQEAFMTLAEQILGEANPMVGTSSSSSPSSKHVQKRGSSNESSSPSPSSGATSNSYFSFFRGKESANGTSNTSPSLITSTTTGKEPSEKPVTTRTISNGGNGSSNIVDSSSSGYNTSELTTPTTSEKDESPSFKLTENDNEIINEENGTGHNSGSAMKKTRCC